MTAPRRSLARRSWPVSSRSLVGGALVTVAVGGVLWAHRAAVQPPESTVVVAARPLLAGTELSAADVATVPAVLDERAEALRGEQLDDLLGRRLLRTVANGAILSPPDLGAGGTTTPAGATVVTVEAPGARAPSDLRPGVAVDVFATDADRDTTELVVSGALVVGVPDAPGSDTSTIGTSLGLRVDLAVADTDVAAALVDAAVRRELTLVVPDRRPERG